MKGTNITSLISVVNKGTSSVNQMRNIMFLPYDKIGNTKIFKEFKSNNMEAVLFENSHYKLEIRGQLLSQFHRDILDVIFAEGKLEPMAGERGYVHFSIYSILKRLGLRTDGEENYKRIEKKLKELKKVDFVLTSREGLFEGDWVAFNLCDRAEYSKKLQEFVLVFSDSYLSMFQSDIMVDYNKYVPVLVQMQSATLKALIRYVISNDFMNKPLDVLLEEIEVKRTDMTNRNFNIVKQKIKSHKEELEAFGITISDTEQVRYSKLKEVRFYNVKKELGKQEIIDFGKQ